MATTLYWKERLTEGCIFYAGSSYILGNTYKAHKKGGDDTWPHAVARSTLYEDYCIWHREAYLPQFVNMPHYLEHPEDLPVRADELGFYATLGPWLYVVGKARQVRSYAVQERVFQLGAWHEVRRKRNFVRLCSIEVHRAAFQLYTGQDFRVVEPIQIVTEAQQDCRERTERNRASMPIVPPS